MPETPPIFFSSLVVDNVRCFGSRQELDLTIDGQPARWSLLIGENGTGKTTLLECLVRMRPVPAEPAPDQTESSNRPGGVAPLSSGGLKAALTDAENNVLETLPREGAQRVTLNATLSFGGTRLLSHGGPQGNRLRADDIGTDVDLTFGKQGQLLHSSSPETAEIGELRDKFHDPLIVAYGANRYLGDHNLPKRRVDELDSLDCERLSRGTELYDVEEILMGLDYASRQSKSAPEGRSLELLKDVISRILNDHQGIEEIQIHPPDVLEIGRPSGVCVKTFTGLVPMSALSLGHQTTAGWVMDLAWRFLNRYRGFPNPLAEPAIVLIDEIDLHLHPRWQRKIMNDLGKLFPATQFIATSHSPLIVQAAETANLVLLQRRASDVEIVNDPSVPRDLRVDQILTSLLFGVPSPRGERVERLLAQRAQLMDNTERSREEEDLLDDVHRQIRELPTAPNLADQDAMDLIRQFATRVKDTEDTGL